MRTELNIAGLMNPFPGLRPFREDEEFLFFGRENQVDAMVNKLAATRFLAVVGTSGSGKSSLVNCGLRPALHAGLMARAGTSWRIAQFRPKENPLRSMARALAQDGVLFRDYEAGVLTLDEIIDTTLRMCKLGLIDIYEQARLGKDINLLLVVDQFEELFRYRELGACSQKNTYGVSEEVTSFVNLLLEIRKQTAYPIYVVLTMRSDFLGDCAEFAGLPEAINAGQYLVPRMTRDERREAISGPIGVGGAEITPMLLTRLVNDVGDNPDQLSILQHALNRTWACWQLDGNKKEPLDLKHYEAIGTMAHALDQHAEQAYSELNSEQQQICAKLFKALTDKATDVRGVRRPTILRVLCALTNATEAEVTQVIDVFRKPSRSFLMPPAGEALEAETVIDISHESLMRVWKRLNAWANEEARSAQTYRRLEETSILHREGRAGLWRNPDLASALRWKNKEHPCKVWATQYGGNFDCAIQFLEASQQESEREAKEKKDARQQELREQRQRAEEQARIAEKFRRYAYFFGFMFVILILAGVFAWSRMLESTSLRNQHLARELVDRAERESEDSNNEFGVLLALEAVNLAHQQQHRLLRILPDFLSGDLPDIRAESISALHTHVRDFHITFSGHTDEITSIAFGSDGNIAASASKDKTVRLWNTQTGKEIRALSEHDKPVKFIAFSPDGELLATASDDSTAILWDVSDVNNPKKLHVLEDHEGPVQHLAFSPDGELLASASKDNSVKIWKSRNGELLQTLGHGDELYRVTFNPAGDKLATASKDGMATVWDTDNWEVLHKLKGILEGKNGKKKEKMAVTDVAFAPKQPILATVGENGMLRLWDIENGEILDEIKGKDKLFVVAFSPDGKYVVAARKHKNILGAKIEFHKGKLDIEGNTDTFEGHEEQIYAIAFSPDSKYFASASKDGTAKVWDLASKQVIRSMDTHKDQVYAVVFSPDGDHLMTGSRDRTARIWNWDEISASTIIPPFSNEVTFNADGTRYASGSRCEPVKVWDIMTGNEIFSLKAKNWIDTILFNPDGTRIATSMRRGSAKVWDAATGDEIFELKGTDTITTIVISPDGTQLATGNLCEPVKVWDAATGDEIVELKSTDAIAGMAFSPDGTLLVTRSRSGPVKVWDAATGDEIAELKGTEAIAGMTFSPDGTRLVTRSRRGRVKIWDAATGDEIGELKGTHAIAGMAFSPDGTRLVTRSRSGRVKIWDAATGEKIGELKGTDAIATVAFSPDGRRLATSMRRGSAKVWDAATGDEILKLKSTDAFTTVAFSPDGTRLVTRSGSGTVQVWDAATGDEIVKLKSTDAIATVAFSPDGTRLATGIRHGSAKVWDAATGDEIVELKSTDAIATVVFSPDGTRLVTRSRSEPVKVWDAATGDEIAELKGTDVIATIVFNPDGTRLVIRRRGEPMNLWDATTGQKISMLTGTDFNTTVVFSPEGTRLVTRSRSEPVKVWDAATGDEIAELKGTDAIATVVFSPGGRRLATGIRRGSAKVWDAATGDEIAELKGTDAIATVAFSPDGRRLATGIRRGSAKVWDASTGEEIVELKGTDAIATVVFRPDGAQLVTRSRSGAVKVWNAETGDKIVELKGTEAITTVVFNHDGTRLATGSKRPENVWDAKIWDATTGREMFSIMGTDSIASVAFSPDGSSLIIRSRSSRFTRNDQVNVWDFSRSALVRLAKQFAQRSFTLKECKRLSSTFEACIPILQIEEARSLFDKGDIDNALEIFQNVLEEAHEPQRILRTVELDPKLASDLNRAASIWASAQLLVLVKSEAEQGSLEKAIQLLKKAKSLDLKLEINVLDIKKLRAIKLVNDTRPLVWRIKTPSFILTDQSLDNLEKDGIPVEILEKLQSMIGRGYRTESRFLTAIEKKVGADQTEEYKELILKQAKEQLLRDIDDINTNLTDAFDLDDSLPNYPELWGTLCWNGILQNQAEAMKNACVKAVEMDPENGSYRDNLAVARALTLDPAVPLDPDNADVKAVIQGFEYYVTWATGKRTERRIERRKQWIQDLKNGINPFDTSHREKTLRSLKYE